MAWFTRLRNVFWSNRVSDEIDREMAFHLAERADDLVAGGMSPDAARREARRRFGNYALQKEDTRDHDLLGWLETTGADVRYAMRACRRAPGFAGVAILSLALGIGANTAIFTLINVAMLKSLPVSRPEDLVRVTLNLQREPSKRDPGAKSESCCTQGVWERIRDHHDTFASVFAYGATSGADLSTGGESRPVIVGLVTGGFFSTLGMRPAAGRILVDTDDRPNCPPVAVISHGFWHSEFGGSPTTVGQSVTLNGRPFEIVGVADRSFFGVEFGFSPRIWAPQCAGTAIRGGYQGGGWVVGRLKPGLTFEQGAAMLASLAPPDSAFALEPFAHGIPFLSGLYGQALFVLMAIVGIVLLVACANIANLLLARATARQREIAVRLALGASRFRLVRQLLTESLVLSLAGAGLGLLFAMWGSRALVGLFPNIDPPDLTPDATVLAFTLGVCALTSVLFGLAPAGLLFAPRKSQAVDPHLLIKSGGRTLGEGPSRFSIAKTLVVAQIALSLVMVIGAGLLVTTWQQLVAIDPGFRSDGVLLTSVNTRPARLPRNQLGPTYTRILDDLRAMPGVVSASAAWVPPFTANSRLAIDVAGFTPAMPGDAVVRLNQISDGYFRTLRTPLLAGRDFGPTDVPTSPSVAIVNEALARKFFGVADVVGRTFRVKEGAGLSEPVQIVGVAGNTKWMTLREESQAIVYYALGQAQARGNQLRASRRRGGVGARARREIGARRGRPAVLTDAGSSSAAHRQFDQAPASARPAVRLLRRAGAAARDDRALRRCVVQRRAPPERNRRADCARRRTHGGHRHGAEGRQPAGRRRRRHRPAFLGRWNPAREDLPLRRHAHRSVDAGPVVPRPHRRRHRRRDRAGVACVAAGSGFGPTRGVKSCARMER
jgi:predicted permease